MVQFYKTRNVKSPNRGTKFSAGIDFFIPEYNDIIVDDLLHINKDTFFEYKGDEGFYIQANGGRILIPSGIKVNFPKEYALIAFNKSGIASKRGLIVGPCVVDHDYKEEILIGLINTSSAPVLVKYGEKIIQFVLVLVGYDEVVETFDEKYLHENIESNRKGGFGSTGLE